MINLYINYNIFWMFKLNKKIKWLTKEIIKYTYKKQYYNIKM
jgi:hypothetical protein